jgi:hypothetical protein
MLTKEALGNFITQSPFSFKNPIFFSVPTRDMNVQHNVHHLLKDTKRKLFEDKKSAGHDEKDNN